MKPLDLPPSPEPWIETRQGGLFFVNAVLVAPVLMVLYPLVLRWLLRTFAGLDRPSRMLDPVPEVAAYVAPVVGWLALPAALLALYTLRRVERTWARVALGMFLVAHLGVLVYTVGRWLA